MEAGKNNIEMVRTGKNVWHTRHITAFVLPDEVALMLPAMTVLL
jgi:hypothetical protein